jgi:hypothetical protein
MGVPVLTWTLLSSGALGACDRKKEFLERKGLLQLVVSSLAILGVHHSGIAH